ncbi:MAG: molybdopterin oxidoreductase [Alphaproteobacteria bacterium]|nr:molybdopterin oxidoreductase [Alphaproteobacteria bacterium]
MGAAGQKKTVPVYCYQCVAGPDLLRVEVEDGVATRIESNLAFEGDHPGGARVCVRAYGLIQKTYNPNRIRQPMKRTNPLKGREHDPGFVPISWDEALDMVAGKLRGIREQGLKDESGYPRLAISFGGGGTPTQFMGTFPAFLAAWGPFDQGFGSGQGVKCYHSEHLYGEFWHRAFIVSPDTPHTRYVISCGNNTDASAGVAGVWRNADARAKGLKRIQVEPHLSISAATSAEWVPIKPKTDAAFLYALIHRLIVERDWRETCDVPFLRDSTNSPYLVGPNGYYLRDLETRKPLMWDAAAGRSAAHDTGIKEPAIDGVYTVAAAIEIGPDGKEWVHRDVEGRTAFRRLVDFIRKYSPDWAEKESDVPADRIRRIADEYSAAACIGETIEIEGKILPYRPVAVILGKTVNNGWGGYNATWARTLLACLVGALEVPGGTLGTNVKLNRPADDRRASAKPGPDGFMFYPFNETSKEGWQAKPHIRNAYRTLVPLAANSAWSAALGPAHLPWLFQRKLPDHWPKQTLPSVWLCYKTNPAISFWDTAEIAKRIAEFPFTVAFAYTQDETNWMADVLLPDATDLEGLQLIQMGSTKFIEQFWHRQGWALRQPVVDSPVDSRDMSNVATELARRVGILEGYNEAINRGAAGVPLRGEGFDYGIDPKVPHDREVIWDRACRAASHDLSDGKEIHDLAWFKEHGAMFTDFPQLNWYLYPHMRETGLRFEMPYQERIRRHGEQLANRLHEVGIEWWDKQLEEYEALPEYKPFPDIFIDYAKEVGRDPFEFPFWALTARSMQYSWGSNVGIPLINEVAQNVAGHKGVIINTRTARDMDIKEGDPVVISSVVGETRGRAVLRQGIRPDTIVMIGQFDHWATPYAKDFHRPSLNPLVPMALSLTDATGSGSDVVRVALRKDESHGHEAHP